MGVEWEILLNFERQSISIIINLSFLCLLGDIFVLVFSMDSRESFEEVQRLREQILETKYSASLPQTQGTKVKKVIPKVPMVIAGNKCDKDMK